MPGAGFLHRYLSCEVTFIRGLLTSPVGLQEADCSGFMVAPQLGSYALRLTDCYSIMNQTGLAESSVSLSINTIEECEAQFLSFRSFC